MVLNKGFKAFDDALLDLHPDLKSALKPNDYYPEFNNILKNIPCNLPVGSLNTKIIINDGEVVERIYKTPHGEVISLFSNSSNKYFTQVA